MNRLSSTLLLLAGTAALASCADQRPTPVAPDGGGPAFAKAAASERYVILGANEQLPADLAARVAAAGGALVEAHGEIGVAVATSSSAGFAAAAGKIAGVESVARDLTYSVGDPRVVEADLSGAGPAPAPAVASIADDEGFYFLQWAPAAIRAPEAWNLGYTGQGVRVAVLDGGIHSAHVDLDGNLDAGASRSFVPGFAYNQDTGTFWHGTHVAGIIAAEDNGIGTIGIAPHATIVGVKVLHSGSGQFSWLVDGIMYAATPRSQGGAGAHVINMSLGATITGAKDKDQKKDLKELEKAIDRATKFAHQQGVVVVAAAGNDGLDHDDNDTVTFPAQNSHVVSVAATGPFGWALGATNFERPASYTNFGKRLVTVAAPGGDFALPGEDLCQVGPIVNRCWVFDMYLSTSRGGAASTAAYSWAAGTSMASPVTAGVVALIIEREGIGSSPAKIESRLRSGALDLGKKGNDPYYGHGWVNALGSVTH